jgi:outer membrane protein OmpA-like peptidoglycan-associated protein
VLGTAGRLNLRARVGALGGPTFVDATCELRDFAIPRTNPYMQHFTAWTARQGRLTTTITARVEDDTLQARSQTQLGGLQVMRVAAGDAAEKRVGLPLGMIVALLKDRQGNIKLALPVSGTLSDPRFDLHDAIWGAVRTISVKLIAAPVSWIGRLRYTRDSKIQDIEVDPVPFAVGGDALTREATERVGRIAAFMKELPDVRMILTPAVSLGDVEALKTEEITARIREIATQQKLSERDAAARLYAERYPKHEPPDDVKAIVTALREVEPPPEEALYKLAKRRADAVRDAIKKADVDPTRLQVNKEPDALDTFDAGRVDFALSDTAKQRRTLAEMLRALMQALTQRLQALTR